MNYLYIISIAVGILIVAAIVKKLYSMRKAWQEHKAFLLELRHHVLTNLPGMLETDLFVKRELLRVHTELGQLKGGQAFLKGETGHITNEINRIHTLLTDIGPRLAALQNNTGPVNTALETIQAEITQARTTLAETQNFLKKLKQMTMKNNTAIAKLSEDQARSFNAVQYELFLDQVEKVAEQAQTDKTVSEKTVAELKKILHDYKMENRIRDLDDKTQEK